MKQLENWIVPCDHCLISVSRFGRQLVAVRLVPLDFVGELIGIPWTPREVTRE
jgi:hypothetical protein